MRRTILEMLRNNLRTIRKNMRLSGEEIAKRASISYSTYNNIETGKSKPMLETALKIAEVLKTTVETLFNLGENK